MSEAVQLSRATVLRGLAVVAAFLYLAAAALVMAAVEPLGIVYAWAARLICVFGATFAAMMLLPPGHARSWIKLQIAKHLFRHRYDYRAEWLRFTRTLGESDAGEPLPPRIERALAEIVDSPAACLMIAGTDGRLEAASGTIWPSDAQQGASADFARMVARDQRILDADALRAPAPGANATEQERALAPAWLIADDSIWAGVPLVHGDTLAGLVLLARPAVDRRLDWEDFDMLFVAGRQVACHLAEARGQEALAEGRRFHEFNRRFAFIVHDVKNLASQLGLVARNAERHADNPAFRADMVATLNASVARLESLLQRLSPQPARADAPRLVAAMDVLESIAQRRRAQHPIRLSGRPDLFVSCDPGRLENAIAHLVQNAIEASPAGEPVWLSAGRRGLEVEFSILDRGRGMTAEFIRHGLFVPFRTTKAGGFGIGAYEARALVSGIGGRLEVESREGEGSRFAILLPLASATEERLRA